MESRDANVDMIDETHRVFLLREKKIASKIWCVIRILLARALVCKRAPREEPVFTLAFRVDANTP